MAWDDADDDIPPCTTAKHQWPVLAGTVFGSWAEGFIVVRFDCLRPQCNAVKFERWEMVDRQYNNSTGME